MIIDGIPATTVSPDAPLAERAVATFLRFIENRLGVTIVRDGYNMPTDAALIEPLQLGRLFVERGIIQKFSRSTTLFADEPHTKSWFAVCNDSTSHTVGGTTLYDDAGALYATLAEGLERYIWFTQTDYFVNPVRATTQDMEKKAAVVRPERFAGFSEQQRAQKPERALREDATYLWIAGASLVSGTRVHIPAQTVSRAGDRAMSGGTEPYIRQTTTNGLATWPTKKGAQLAGILELIERDAYMTQWLNQLTLPRLSLRSLCAKLPAIAELVATCNRYRLAMHVIPLLTDAPTHAVAVILEDTSGHTPRFAVGLRAHRSLATAIQKATTEALRARRFSRSWAQEGNTWDLKTRVHYWSHPENARALEFMIAGPEVEYVEAAWENDSEDAHLQRIISWCAESNMECISVPLTASKKNPTPWHIEMMVMPELQPTYLTEELQAFGGTRWREIPKKFGYTPRAEPFADRPHPFS
jgi:thiazole/oxazole-forming peptide maturase SagD family component